MPWDVQKRGDEYCVVKKTTGKVMHCYGNENDAKDYLAALYANAHEKELSEALIVSKQTNGKYKIIAVSTAALKDREGETFTTDAMDYDIKLAEATEEYPEFRLFHKKALAFGKVTKMRRVGIFAVDEGESYDDPFSISVCEKMLVPNPGRWKVSRGFYIIETSGGCPTCATPLLVGAKQMKIGFKCPTCQSAYLDYKGVLSDVHFRKTKTFDVTITDIPAVPWTGVAAFREPMLKEFTMTKKELEQRLLKAGLPADAIAARLEGLSDAQLKEFDGVPFAEVLKEFDDDDSDGALDIDDVVKEFAKVVESTVEAKMKEVLNGFELNVTDLGELEVDMKEVGEITAMKESIEALSEEVAELKELLSKLLEKDESRLKELLDDMPRDGKLRIRRHKEEDMKKKRHMMDMSDDEEDDDEDEEYGEKELEGVIVGADGETAPSMTAWLTQRK